MKTFINIYICSAAANTCIEPYKWPDFLKVLMNV